nr:unnamed protein product [Spirometra erinaceieuropaei]
MPAVILPTFHTSIGGGHTLTSCSLICTPKLLTDVDFSKTLFSPTSSFASSKLSTEAPPDLFNRAAHSIFSQSLLHLLSSGIFHRTLVNTPVCTTFTALSTIPSKLSPPPSIATLLVSTLPPPSSTSPVTQTDASRKTCSSFLRLDCSSILSLFTILKLVNEAVLTRSTLFVMTAPSLNTPFSSPDSLSSPFFPSSKSF